MRDFIRVIAASLLVVSCSTSAFAQSDDETPVTPTMCAIAQGQACADERCTDSADPATCGVLCAVSARINCDDLVAPVDPLAPHETPLSELTIINLLTAEITRCSASRLFSASGVAEAEVLECLSYNPTEPPDCSGPVAGPGPCVE